MEAAIPVMGQLLITSNDEEVLTDVCWGLSYASDGDNERIQKVRAYLGLEGGGRRAPVATALCTGGLLLSVAGPLRS